MALIGNPIISTDFPKDTFSGNGSTTAFTMSIAPASVNAVIVVVSGITQDPSTYTISGTTLTFSAAPPTGTSNISVRHLGVAGTPQVPATGSVVPASMSTGAPSWNSTGTLTVTNSAGSTIVANRTSNPGSIEIQHSGTQTAQLSAVSGGGLEFYRGSSPTLAMKYDSAGRVTIPSQPAFDASGGGGTASGDLNSNCSWYANVNTGSNFSTSTGRFTAPVAGTYYFWSISVAQTDGVPSRTKLVKNGTAVYDISGGGPRQARNGLNANTGFIAWVITLAANDYVNLNTVATINAESAYLGFGGYLIG